MSFLGRIKQIIDVKSTVIFGQIFVTFLEFQSHFYDINISYLFQLIICWQDSMENQACSQFIIFISLYICMAIFLWFLGKYKITLIYVREAIFKNNEIAPKRYLFSSNMVGYANKSGEKKSPGSRKRSRKENWLQGRV